MSTLSTVNGFPKVYEAIPRVSDYYPKTKVADVSMLAPHLVLTYFDETTRDHFIHFAQIFSSKCGSLYRRD